MIHCFVGKIVLSLALMLVFNGSMAQLTLLVTDLPSNTPSTDKIYVAGNFQTWGLLTGVLNQ